MNVERNNDFYVWNKNRKTTSPDPVFVSRHQVYDVADPEYRILDSTK